MAADNEKINGITIYGAFTLQLFKVSANRLILVLAEKGGSRTLRGPYDPQTGFEDQRRHRAPSFSFCVYGLRHFRGSLVRRATLCVASGLPIATGAVGCQASLARSRARRD